MNGHWEIVRTDARQPWHARFVASNGRIVWTSENYRQKASAVNAIDTLARHFSPTDQAWISSVRIGDQRGVDIRYGSRGHQTWADAHRLDVRLVDERSTDICSCGHPRSDHHSRVGCSVYTETNGFCECVEGT